jgi:glutamate/tyrosine decarboxylase-like PLP-dependent enzyme
MGSEGDGPELELDVQQATELIGATVSRILEYRTRVASGSYPASYVHDSVNVREYADGLKVAAELREDAPPEHGSEVATLLATIFERAFPNGTIHPHPGFMAHVPSGGLLQAAVGDFIARALNRFPGVWVAAPGLIQLERNVIRWFCTLLGYGTEAFGYLTTSGSLANLMGLCCAFRRRHEKPKSRPILYISDQAHFSVIRAARLIGIEPSRIRVVKAQPDCTMDLQSLARQIRADQGSRSLTCVVATAGTTSTGAIDHLDELATLCAAQSAWLHVDACLGGFFRLTTRGKTALHGIERASSIAVDAHKSLFLPHGSSALLVRDRAALSETFAVPETGYLPGSTGEPELADFCGLGPELTREVRGLTVWLPIKLHGVEAFRRSLDGCLDLALYLAKELERIPGIEVVRKHAIQLPIVLFRPRPDLHGGAADAAAQRLCAEICARGRAYITTTVIPDVGVVLRACILNHMTDRNTVERLVEDVRALASRC